MRETAFLLIPDHRARARRRMITPLRDKPRMLALVSALAAGVQEVEEITFSLIVSRTLAASTGAQLDQWGALVGEPRDGLEDADYRRFVEARILVNLCDSTTDPILAIWEKVTGPGWVRERGIYPAAFALETTRGALMTLPILRRVRRMMVDVKPIGVAMYRVEALTGGFGFGPPYTGFGAGGFARSF